MSDLIQLDYSNDRRRWSVLAIIAIILGIGSGPVIWALVRLTGIAYGIAQVGTFIAIVVGVAVASFCIMAFHMARRPQVRGRYLALIGLVSTVLWTIGMIALFCWIDAQLV